MMILLSPPALADRSENSHTNCITSRPNTLCAFLFTFVLWLVGCGGSSNSATCVSNCNPTPAPTPSEALLYVNTNGVIPGVHGYKIQSNGSLSELSGSPFTF